MIFLILFQVQTFFLATVLEDPTSSRHPLRLAVSRRFLVSRYPTPRFIDGWKSLKDEAEDNIPVRLTNRIRRLQGWDSDVLEPSEKEKLGIEDGEVIFVPLHARYGARVF